MREKKKKEKQNDKSVQHLFSVLKMLSQPVSVNVHVKEETLVRVRAAHDGESDRRADSSDSFLSSSLRASFAKFFSIAHVSAYVRK